MEHAAAPESQDGAEDNTAAAATQTPPDAAYDPRAARAETATLAAQLEGHAHQVASQLQAAGAQHASQIQSGAQAQKQAVEQAMTLATAATRAESARVKQASASTSAAQAATARAQASAAAAAQAAQTSAQAQQVNALAARQRSQFQQQAAAEAARPTRIIDSEATRGGQEITRGAMRARQDGRAAAAQFGGGDDKAVDQRRAALQVGDDTAADIDNKSPSLGSEVRARSQELQSKHRTFIGQVMQQLGQAVPGILQSVQRVGQSAQRGIQQSAATAAAGLRAGQAQAQRAAAQAEGAATAQLRSTARSVGAGLLSTARQQAAQLRRSAGQLAEQVRQRGATWARALRRVQRPSVTENRSFVAAAQGALGQSLAQASGQLGAAAGQGQAAARQLAASGQSRLSSIVGAARRGLGRALTTAQAGAQKLVGQQAAQVARIRATTDGQQAQCLQQGGQALSQAGSEAIQRMRGANDRYQSEVKGSVDKGVGQATGPATQVRGNAQQAAEHAGKEHEKSLLGKIASGIWSAIKSIVKGLVIVIALAVVVAVVMAAFGVALTAAGAMLIAGGILLVVGGTMAYLNRREHGEGVGASLLGAAMDSIGVTGIKESITGRDDITGEKLDAEQRTERGVLGGFQLVMTALGVRGAVKGPLRVPGGFPEGLGRFGRAVQASKRVLVEPLKTGRELLARLRERFGRKPTGAAVEPAPGESPKSANENSENAGDQNQSKVDEGKAEDHKADSDTHQGAEQEKSDANHGQDEQAKSEDLNINEAPKDADPAIKEHWNDWPEEVRQNYLQARQQIEGAEFLVRRMSAGEYESTYGEGKGSVSDVFIKGTEGNRVYSLDDPYAFAKPERNARVGDYTHVAKVRLTAALKDFLLRRLVPDKLPGKIPGGLKNNPRFKIETGRYNVVIPKSIWTEFMELAPKSEP